MRSIELQSLMYIEIMDIIIRASMNFKRIRYLLKPFPSVRERWTILNADMSWLDEFVNTTNRTQVRMLHELTSSNRQTDRSCSFSQSGFLCDFSIQKAMARLRKGLKSLVMSSPGGHRHSKGAAFYFGQISLLSYDKHTFILQAQQS